MWQAVYLRALTGKWSLRISIWPLSLLDDAKIYIPAVGEQMVTSGNGTITGSANVLGVGTKTVNINQASESELDSLPGVGPETEQKIIDNRPYSSVQDLLIKKAVGQSVVRLLSFTDGTCNTA